MTDTLSRLEALHAAATEGRWVNGTHNEHGVVRSPEHGLVVQAGPIGPVDANATAIAALHNTAPALFAVVRAAQEVHTSWYGGCLDTDYDRIASAFDGLTAALNTLEASDD